VSTKRRPKSEKRFWRQRDIKAIQTDGIDMVISVIQTMLSSSKMEAVNAAESLEAFQLLMRMDQISIHYGQNPMALRRFAARLLLALEDIYKLPPYKGDRETFLKQLWARLERVRGAELPKEQSTKKTNTNAERKPPIDMVDAVIEMSPLTSSSHNAPRRKRKGRGNSRNPRRTRQTLPVEG
jgi:hypothetical protein